MDEEHNLGYHGRNGKHEGLYSFYGSIIKKINAPTSKKALSANLELLEQKSVDLDYFEDTSPPPLIRDVLVLNQSFLI